MTPAARIAHARELLEHAQTEAMSAVLFGAEGVEAELLAEIAVMERSRDRLAAVIDRMASTPPSSTPRRAHDRG